MSTLKASVKESLLGVEKEPDLSLQTKANFDKHARQDESTGEAYMTEEDFVDSIAPASENYVSYNNPNGCHLPHSWDSKETPTGSG